MSGVLVSYASGHGTTEAFARSVAEGAEAVQGVKVTLKKTEDTTVTDFASADGVILGSPVHMGSIDWRVKKLIDEVCAYMWISDSAVGKVGGVFVCGSGVGNVGGGSELAMLTMLANLAELGMVIVPLPRTTPGYFTNGLHWGPAGITGENEDHTPVGVPDEQLIVARHHGMNVARVTAALAGQRLLNP